MVTENARPMSRQLFVAIVLAIVVEGALYSALVPQLPQLTRQFGLSPTASGLLMSGYSGGLVLGSLLCIPLLRRLPARAGVVLGLAIFAVTTAVFAVTTDSAVLLMSRLGQGVSSGLLWTACVVWLLSTSAPQRRGATLGRALSYTFIGTVAGPAIGTLATQIGRPISYLTVAAMCLCVTVWVLLLVAPSYYSRSDSAPGAGQTGSAPRSVAFLGIWVVAYSGMCIGMVNVVGPLWLSGLGAADLSIGAVFIVAAVATISVSALAGIGVDRFGAATPLIGSCIVTVVLFALTPMLGSWPLYASATVATLTVLFVCFVSGQTALTRSGEDAGWSLQFCTAISAVTWGGGETVGAVLAGTGLGRWGPNATVIMVTALTLVTLIAVVTVARTRQAGGFQRGVPEPMPPL